MEDFNFIDLFAGAGGFSLGLHMAGFEGVFAIERDPMAYSTLSHNLMEENQVFHWPEWLPKTQHDIKEVLQNYSQELKSLVGKIDLVVGGPPCQGFSLAGRRFEGDTRNTLFKDYVRFVKIVKPRALVFENVPGFAMSFNKGKKSEKSYASLLTNDLVDLGYEKPAQEIIDFSDFGVPQSRKRLLMFTQLDGGDPKTIMGLLKKTAYTKKVDISSAISDLLESHGKTASPDTPKFNAGIYGPPTSSYQKLMRKNLFDSIPDSHRFAHHSPEIRARFHAILQEADRNRSLSKEIRTSLGVRKRNTTPLDPSLPSPTLTTLPDDYIHYSEPRILTVREYARIQSFPDWFKFKGKYTTGGKMRSMETPRYTQVANAIPPLFVSKIAKLLKSV